jgi:hypothetical protein
MLLENLQCKRNGLQRAESSNLYCVHVFPPTCSEVRAVAFALCREHEVSCLGTATGPLICEVSPLRGLKY